MVRICEARTTPCRRCAPRPSRDGSLEVRLGPGDQRRQPVTRVWDAVGVAGGVVVFVAAGGVGDRGEDEGEGAAVEAGGEVAEVDGVAVGDAGGCVQDPIVRCCCR